MNCSNCGRELLDGEQVCNACGTQAEVTPVAAQKPENVLTGVVGALIGAVLGGASIVLLSQMGYVAGISGLILAVCTLKGYELLGGQLTKRGIMISCLLMLITPYIADRIDWAIWILQEFPDYGLTFADAFAIVHEVADPTAYFSGLGMVYLFVVLGAFGTLKGLFKKK